MTDLSLYLFAQKERIKTLYAYRNRSWRKLPILENGEKLVIIPFEMCHPFYYLDMKISNSKDIFIREDVFSRFLVAKKIASSYGFDLIVFDGWRSIELQESLFWYYLKKFIVEKFNMKDVFSCADDVSDIKRIFLSLPENNQVLMMEANRSYVSWPSSDPFCPSPHATGGSIDVWLYRDNVPVNLGVPFIGWKKMLEHFII